MRWSRPTGRWRSAVPTAGAVGGARASRGEVVSSDRLIDELWGERPPATAAKTVQVYVSELRKALGDGCWSPAGTGTCSTSTPGRSTSSVRAWRPRARSALEQATATRQRRGCARRLALWRGHGPGRPRVRAVRARRSRLEEERLGGTRGPDRRRPRARPHARYGRGARGAGRGAPAARAGARPS